MSMTKAKPLPKLLAPTPVGFIPGAWLAVNLPFPLHRRLSPNYGASQSQAAARNRATVVKRERAKTAKEARAVIDAVPPGYGDIFPPDSTISVRVIAGWQKGHNTVDQTNMGAYLKAYIDGMADAVGVDDRHFRLDSVEQVRDADGHGWTRFVLSVDA